jgi:hypothetical protein
MLETYMRAVTVGEFERRLNKLEDARRRPG